MKMLNLFNQKLQNDRENWKKKSILGQVTLENSNHKGMRLSILTHFT